MNAEMWSCGPPGSMPANARRDSRQMHRVLWLGLFSTRLVQQGIPSLSNALRFRYACLSLVGLQRNKHNSLWGQTPWR